MLEKVMWGMTYVGQWPAGRQHLPKEFAHVVLQQCSGDEKSGVGGKGVDDLGKEQAGIFDAVSFIYYDVLEQNFLSEFQLIAQADFVRSDEELKVL
ncbi:hypothetical protein FRC10_007770, partial [Ceratobasidium sp. 414]